MCALAGIEAAALTDHNTVGNCAAFCEAAARYGVIALPGMELTTAEEVHVVCVFGELDAARAFEAEVFRRLPPLDNDPRVFGPQVKMDSGDTVLGEERRMLSAASGIGIYEVPGLVAGLGGACWPAHIDRPSFSLISNLGLWDPELGFSFAEVSRACPPRLSGPARPEGPAGDHRLGRPLSGPDHGRLPAGRAARKKSGRPAQLAQAP